MITEQQVIEICRRILDPEVQLDIYTLGLIYDIRCENNEIDIVMTYTTPACPFGDTMQKMLREALSELNPQEIRITVTFDPPWRVSQELRDMLGI